MRIAFIVLAHHKPRDVVRLVKRLSVSDAPVYLHVDKKTDVTIFRQMIDELQKLPNLDLLPRHRCQWGGFGMVAATLDGMGAALARGADYVVLLSGQDYPIKPYDELYKFLEINRGLSFLEYFSLPREDWGGEGGMQRFKHRKVGMGPLTVRLRNRRFLSWLPCSYDVPHGYHPYQGGSWWLMHASAVGEVLHHVREMPDFVRAFHRVSSPDESFFQTILLNSGHREWIVNDDCRYEDWSAGEDHPAILTMNHFERLRQARGFFARKFDQSVDDNVLTRIDCELLRVT